MVPNVVRPLVLSLIMLVGACVIGPGASLAQQTTSSAQGENRFASEQFGYLLEWEAPWESSGQMVQELFEGVILTNGNKMSGVMALSAHGGQITFESEVEVLDFVVDGLVANVPDATVAVEDRNALVPWTELTYTGPQGPARSFVEVFSLASAGAYMYSIVEGPNAEFEEALVQAAEAILLDGKVFVAQERAGQSPSDANSRDHQDTDRPPARGGGAAPADETVAMASYRGGPAHTGEQPGPAPIVAPEQAWAYATGDAFVGATPAAVSAEHGLVFTSSNAVYAIDMLTGEEVWSYKSELGLGFIGPLALANGVLYAGGEDGHVYAFEPASGDIIWQSELTSRLAVNGGPLLAGDRLFVTSWDANAYALEPETGEILWSSPTGGVTLGQPAYAGRFIIVPGPLSPETFNGVLAIDAQSGELAGTFETDGPVFPQPTVSGEVLYVASQNGILYAVDLVSGAILWSVQIGLEVTAAPAVSDGVVYVTSDEASLGAYDAETGVELWTVVANPGSQLGGISVTATDDGTVLILVGDSSGTLHAFGEHGQEVYAVDVTDSEIVFPATVVDGVIYVAAGDGTVYALAAER
jgi:outer membrane protein assembly factor BamB